MTPKQQKVYDFMKLYHKKKSRPAGLTIIKREMGFRHYQTVQYYMDILMDLKLVINPERGIYIAK